MILSSLNCQEGTVGFCRAEPNRRLFNLVSVHQVFRGEKIGSSFLISIRFLTLIHLFFPSPSIPLSGCFIATCAYEDRLAMFSISMTTSSDIIDKVEFLLQFDRILVYIYIAVNIGKAI